jgi:4-amino-4-deoxy-L-arabinose transferase-like glycosyltransferase
MSNGSHRTAHTHSGSISARSSHVRTDPDTGETNSPLTHYSLLITQHAIHLLLAVFIFIAATYSILTPPFETPDEIWHFAFIQHVATGQGLPVAEPNSKALWRQQGVQAPGYYLAAVALTAWIDQSDFPAIYDRANPHRAIGQPDAPGNRNYLVHYPAEEGWPWRGSILALHLARFFSIFLGAVTIYAVYRTVDLILGRSAALLGAAFVAFIPQFVFISAAASNDNAINAAAALVLWQLVAMMRRGEEARRRREDGGLQTADRRPQMEHITRNTPIPNIQYVLSHHLIIPSFLRLGLFLGLALISKLSALALVGLSGLTILWIAWRARSWRPIGMAILWIGGPVLLIAGWWYGRNWLLYGDPLAWAMWEANILLRVVPADAGTILGELGGLFRSFWGLFGWMNVAYPEWIYWVFGGLSLLIGAGLLLRSVNPSLTLPARREGTDLLPMEKSVSQPTKDPPPVARCPQRLLRGELEGGIWRLTSMGLLLLWLLLLTYSWLRFMQIAPAAQGRYFFPAASTLALIFVLGLHGFGRRLGEYMGWGIVCVLALLTLLTPFFVIRPVYAVPEPSIHSVQSAMVRLGMDEPLVAILSASASPDQLHPGETVQIEITWQTLAALPEDYSVFVHLVDEEGFTISQHDTMPSGGRLPTSRWQPGQIISDQYSVTVPPTAYAPNRGAWRVGLYHHQTGERLPLLDRDGDSFTFGDLILAAPESPFADWVPNPMKVDFADGISLVGYEFSQRRLIPGEEMTVTLYWWARQPVSQDYTTFVHILDQEFTMYGGHDGAPPLPTSAWFSHEDGIIADVHTFLISPDAPPGEYQLEIGLYPWPSFTRLRLLDAIGAEGADRLLLGPLRIVP